MLTAEVVSEIRRLHYAERRKIGTLAAQFGVHPDAMRRALNRPLGHRHRARCAHGSPVRTLRPNRREVFTRLQALPGEAGQVDWADFGAVSLGRAKRRLCAFVLTLS
jgi:hypothetical protein